MPDAIGTIRPGEIIIGEDLFEQEITIAGGPSSGAFSLSMLDYTTDLLSITADAATIEAAIQALPVPCCRTASVSWRTPTVLVLESGVDGAFVEPWRVNSSLSGGTSPEMTRAIVDRRPLTYLLAGPDHTYSHASVPPTIGKQSIPGTVADRASQPKASEWFGRSWLPGLGRLHYRENETVERFWDSNCWTHVDRQVTLPALVETETLDASAGTPYGITNASLGVTVNGVRLVAMFDALGTQVQGTPVYYEPSTQTWQIIPGAPTLASDTAICDIIFYNSYVYMTYANTSQVKTGYLVWDGGSASNAVTVQTADVSRVLAFEEWDGKIFRLLANGKLQWALPSAAAAEADWTPTVNIPVYRGSGYAYALRNFTDRTGSLVLMIIATDGLYQFDFENWRILRVKSVNGPALLVPGVLPQPNSVTEWQGDLYWIHGDMLKKYDGSIISDIGPAVDDGLPERHLAFWSNLRPRALFATNNMLLVGMTKPIEVASPTTIAATTTVAVPTTYYISLTETGAAGVNDSVFTADTEIIDAVDNLGCVLGFNGQGWHTIVPLEQGTPGSPYAPRAILYHELHPVPRLIFAPGKYIRWRDKPANPIFWSDMRWDTSKPRYFTTSWFDLDLTDIAKLLLMLRMGYTSAGSGCKITPYFQINGCPDSSTVLVGNDPSKYLAPFYDEGGAPVVVGDGDDPVSGILKAFYDRDSQPTSWSRGLQVYEVRLTFKLESTDSAMTPTLEFASTVLTAEFNALSSFPIVVELPIVPGTDGRTAQRQANDLIATYQSKHLVPMAVRPGLWWFVTLDFFNAGGLESGDVIEATGGGRVSLTLSEVTRF